MSGAPVSIRLSPLDSPALPRSLRGRLEQRRGELFEGMLVASDWADYRCRVGVIMGITEAIDLCGQIEKDLSGER